MLPITSRPLYLHGLLACKTTFVNEQAKRRIFTGAKLGEFSFFIRNSNMLFRMLSGYFVLKLYKHYAGLYEDLNEIRKSKLENFSKSSKKQSEIRESFGGEYSDPFDIIILDFEIFLIEIIENKGNFKSIIDKYLMNKSRTKELSLETRILLAKYFADDFIHNMKIVYYAHIKNFCDALSKVKKRSKKFGFLKSMIVLEKGSSIGIW
ncbi:hypothetical protein K737_300833 [Holospora undulata HU1]|uniref:Uncharacterized protein n=2 Tax=Holospora TaxID=44747 RepID=A0A061JG46_9PROT|nr:hypothetical protein K737_300833 [Holospora undulata HU1]